MYLLKNTMDFNLSGLDLSSLMLLQKLSLAALTPHLLQRRQKQKQQDWSYLQPEQEKQYGVTNDTF